MESDFGEGKRLCFVARLLDGEAMMGNSLQQQARFDAFRHEFNTERPTRLSP
jgi:hypothetical protein